MQCLALGTPKMKKKSDKSWQSTQHLTQNGDLPRADCDSPLPQFAQKGSTVINRYLRKIDKKVYGKICKNQYPNSPKIDRETQSQANSRKTELLSFSDSDSQDDEVSIATSGDPFSSASDDTRAKLLEELAVRDWDDEEGREFRKSCMSRDLRVRENDLLPIERPMTRVQTGSTPRPESRGNGNYVSFFNPKNNNSRHGQMPHFAHQAHHRTKNHHQLSLKKSSSLCQLNQKNSIVEENDLVKSELSRSAIWLNQSKKRSVRNLDWQSHFCYRARESRKLTSKF